LRLRDELEGARVRNADKVNKTELVVFHSNTALVSARVWYAVLFFFFFSGMQSYHYYVLLAADHSTYPMTALL